MRHKQCKNSVSPRVVVGEQDADNETLVLLKAKLLVECASYHDDHFRHVEPIKQCWSRIHSLMC